MKINCARNRNDKKKLQKMYLEAVATFKEEVFSVVPRHHRIIIAIARLCIQRIRQVLNEGLGAAHFVRLNREIERRAGDLGLLTTAARRFIINLKAVVARALGDVRKVKTERFGIVRHFGCETLRPDAAVALIVLQYQTGRK